MRYWTTIPKTMVYCFLVASCLQSYIAPTFAAEALTSSTTIYVGKHFEVRDNDQPVKYVFNEQTRIARITGSLASRQRLQRLRLHEGWNLVSLAVNATNLLNQLHSSESADPGLLVFRWTTTTRTYAKVEPGENLPAGTVLWIRSSAPRIAGISGEYIEPAQRVVPAGGAYLPSFGLEAADLAPPPGFTLAKFDSGEKRWRTVLREDLSGADELPKVLAPGEVIFIRADQEMVLPYPAPAMRIRYHHQDHLGSAAVITDAGGRIVSETAFYPFGAPRHEHQPGSAREEYSYIGMERDRESALLAFGMRMFAPGLPRFTTADPLAADVPMEWLNSPQKLNPYAYVANNPLNFIDPTGLDGEKPLSQGNKVLIVYGYDMYEHFQKKMGGTKGQYHAALKKAYAEETGNSEVEVRFLNSKEGLQKALKGSEYTKLIFNTHGFLNAKGIRLSKTSTVTPSDLKKYLDSAKGTPAEMYFYGCNTAKTGFAEDVSNLFQKTAVTGSSGIIRQTFTRTGKDFSATENRDYNMTFKYGKKPIDARVADPNAPIGR